MGQASSSGRRWVLVLAGAAVIAAVAALITAFLLIDIMEKKQEAKNPFFRVVDLTDDTEDPAVWGRNFPLQYDRYRRTVDMVRTRFGGSEALPHTPDANDPRTVVSQSKIELDPRLKTMWAGYAFAKDFREERGHAFMLEDQMFTQRQMAAKQPGACLQCHASVYVPMKRLGGGDLFAGFAKLNPLPYAEARQQVKFPVSCIDCHEPNTMRLRVTRPAFIEAYRAYKAAQGINGYDVNRSATRQEMRSFVCAQCHVEYYFKGPEKNLTFPWSNGLRAEQMLAYYDQVGHKDWVHAESGAEVLKAQHPEYEIWTQGIHARAGVACADCHMPYLREGALKISDHHVRSPLLNINNSCQTCHRMPEREVLGRAEELQDNFFRQRNQALDAIVALIGDLKAARAAGRPDAELATARAMQRRAQFLFDLVEAENSTGFHAPQETMRVLGVAINLARQGQLALRDPAYQPQVVWEMPAVQPPAAAKPTPTPAP